MSIQALEWTLGFRNHASGKYLTQETFGFTLNVNGPSLRKKQMFTLVSAADGSVHIKTHLNKFIYGIADGTVKGDEDAPSAKTAWTIEPQADGTWALKTAAGYYFYGTGDNIRAYEKELNLAKIPDAKWTAVLAMHPQINLFSVMRKRFAHFENGEIRCNEDVPWGEDALLNFVFFDEHREGRYGIMAANGQYLTNSGKLSAAVTPDCQFLLGFHDDQISLRDSAGRYLSCVGADGTLKVNKDKVTKDELFQIQDSSPQFTIVGRANDKEKQVSVRSGVEVKADQADVTDQERFQLEVGAGGEVYLKTNKLFYWTVGADGSISAASKTKDNSTAFKIEYVGNRVKFVSAAGKYVTVKPNGGLIANGNGSESSALFTFTIINRPDLVLRGQFGFLGVKGASGRIECNRSRADVFALESKDGQYAFKFNGKYWTVDGDGVAVASSAPVWFVLEFVEESKALVRFVESGKYLEGEQNGGFKATGTGKNINTLWEF